MLISISIYIDVNGLIDSVISSLVGAYVECLGNVKDVLLYTIILWMLKLLLG